MIKNEHVQKLFENELFKRALAQAKSDEEREQIKTIASQFLCAILDVVVKENSTT